MRRKYYYIIHSISALRNYPIGQIHILHLNQMELTELKENLQNSSNFQITLQTTKLKEQWALWEPSLITMKEWLEKYQKILIQ